jgi:alpha-methylacyl-CoA racemase
LPKQHDRARWGELRAAFAERIATRTRAEWEATFAEGDACVAPVLSLAEVGGHPHNAVRGTFLTRDGVLQPAPAPRFSRTEAVLGAPPSPRGTDSEAVLRDWGFTQDEIVALKRRDVVGLAES